MKKVWQTVAVAVVALIPLATSDSALAAEKGTCRVGFTGPDSSNLCTSTKTYACMVTNNNTVEVTNENVQIAVSGSAGSSGNTSGGGATSGSATNSNGVTFNATVDNAGVCSVMATVPATMPPAPAPKPAAPQPSGKGATTQPVAAPEKAAPTVLPHTSADELLPYLSYLVAGLAGAAVLVKAGTVLYSRSKS